MSGMRIDAHQHFWRYQRSEYAWIGEDLAALRRDFLPADLRREMSLARMDGVVSVQARQSLEETRWLLELAAAHDFIQGVVGWVPLAAPRVRRELEIFSAHPKLKGVREVLQGEADAAWLHDDNFHAGVKVLTEFGLAYDLLIFAEQLPAAGAFVDRHPEQIFVLDHSGKPRIKQGGFAPWNRNLRELARRENVYCKLSGLVTEAEWSGWTERELQPYCETVLAAFGANRVMFGSDWPVCCVACPYPQWVESFARLTSGLSAAEQARLFGGTSRQVYRL